MMDVNNAGGPACLGFARGRKFEGMNDVAAQCQECVLGRASQPESCPFYEIKKKPGSLLVEQNEPPTSAWLIRDGQVLLRATDESGAELWCAVRSAGHMIGLELLTGAPSPYRAMALTDVKACALDARAVKAWVGRLDTPGGALLELALGEAGQRGTERSQLGGTAVERVARFLLLRQRENNGPVLDMPQRVLARTLGMSAETLSRALARLRSEGAISRSRPVQVADSDALERLAYG
jgi:CRP-like cAMP-binding protein